MGQRPTVTGESRNGAGTALVGRVSEVATLRAVLSRSGSGTAVLGINGEPGIGKTRLLTELAVEAHRTGRTVLAGRAAEFEREVPFGIVRNAIEDHLGRLDTARLAALAAEDLRLLPHAFPAVRGPGVDLLAAERFRLHRAVRALLEIIAGATGLVLVLDDVHWCDDSSAELLDHLLRHPPQAPVLLAVAYRPRQLPARLHQAIRAAAQRGLATLLDVGPLTFAEATALLPATMSTTRQRELYEASAGNPFYLEVLERSSGTGPMADGEPAALSARAALAGEFAALPPACQWIAHAAAVAGDVFDAALVAGVADVAEEAVLDGFDELSRRDLIRPGGLPGGFQFRHPLLRSAAYHQADAGRRLAAHARAAAELARRGAPLAERAGHVALSAVPGDVAAVEVLRTASVEAMHATPAGAAHWLGAALRLLPVEPATVGTRLELLNLRAQALGITGHLAESRELLAEVLRMLPAGTDHRVTVLTFLTMVEHLLGNHARARALLLRELGDLPDEKGRAAGALRVGLVLTGVMHGDVDAEAVTSAVAVARDVGDRLLLASALGVCTVASQSCGVTGLPAAAWLDEAAELVDAMPEAELAGRLDAALFLGWGEMYLERLGDAGRHLERALHVARTTGQSNLVGSLQTLVGVVRCETGDLRAAMGVLDDALESAVLTGGDETRCHILRYRSWASAWRGEVDAALAMAEESVALAADRANADWRWGPAEAGLGFVRYAAGDADGCLEIMLRAAQGADLPAIRQMWQPRWLEWLAAAATAAGRHREAADFAIRAGRLPTADAPHRRVGFIRLAQVHPALHTDPAAAARSAAEAARLFASAGDRLSAAQARLYAGQALYSLGEAERAAHEVAQARQGFAECGARPDWLARMTGIAVRADAAEPAAAGLRLSPRELTVLTLLAESLTAETIARRLSITTATVHKHLARLYRKLGTTDRLATVLRAQALGLLPQPGNGDHRTPIR